MGKYCAKCGGKLQEGEKFCTKCGTQKEVRKETDEKQTKKKLPKPVKIILIILGAIILISLLSGEDQESQKAEEKEQTSTIEQSTIEESTLEEAEEEPKMSKEDYMKSCQEISYEKLARYPEKYKGTKVKLTGEVIQVIESSWTDSINLRVNVTKDEYGYWDDTVLVDYTYKKEGTKILEDDIITMYGQSEGTESYESVLGATITIPYVTAEYIIIH